MFFVHGKTDDIYKETAGDVEKRFDTSNYELSRPLPKEKKKKVVELMKDELGGKSMKKFVRLITKNYSYLKDGGSEDKKEKDTKKCVIRKKLEFEDYDNCLEATQIENKINQVRKNKTDIECLKKDHKEFIKNNKSILKIQERFNSGRRNAFTEEINKIAFSSNDDKRMQSINLIEIYAYRMRKDLVNEKKEM